MELAAIHFGNPHTGGKSSNVWCDMTDRGDKIAAILYFAGEVIPDRDTMEEALSRGHVVKNDCAYMAHMEATDAQI